MSIHPPITKNDEEAWEERYVQSSNNHGRNNYAIHRFSCLAKYFIAVCNYRIHSYVMAGCDDTSSGQPNIQIFSAVGKSGEVDAADNFNWREQCGKLVGFIRSDNPGCVDDELIIKATKAKRSYRSIQVRYRAYEMTEKQYRDYTRLLQGIWSSNPFNYYCPFTPRATDPDYDLVGSNFRYAVSSYDLPNLGVQQPEMKAECGSKPGPEQKQEGRFKRLFKMGIHNNCRHGALDILSRVNIVDKGISSYWGSRLPNKMIIRGGQIVTPMFIVPIPPSLELKRDNALLYSALQDLHRNIIRLSQTNYGIELARMKVNVLGELYKQLHATRKDSDGYHVLAVIDAWKTQKLNEKIPNNLSLIKQSRGLLIWTRSHTVIEKIEKMALKSVKATHR